MNKTPLLFLVPALAGALSTSAFAQASAAPAGNTGSNAGVSGGAGLGDTPSTAATGISIGSVPVKRAQPVAPGTGTNGTTGTTTGNPGASTGTGSSSAPVGTASGGVVHSSGAGITDGASTRPSGSTVVGSGAAAQPNIVVPSGTNQAAGK